jgi:TolB-like protein/DNA-binding winged helix-turn-helix (wHTH) protein/Flp pilus assembly protein TadD
MAPAVGVVAVTLEPAKDQDSIRFGEDFELDPGAYRLRRSGRVLKLERIPMEVLLLLVERRGEMVPREQIVERIWGKDVFLDTDNSINGAIRKIRQVLKDDPEQPRFIQTVTGKGYRFIAPVISSRVEPAALPMPQTSPPHPVETKTWNRATHGWSVPVALVLLLAVGVAAYFWWPPYSRRPSRPSGRLMLAVLPLENLTGDPAQEYFSDGMTEEMITELGRLDPDRLGVIARTSVMVYKHNPKSLDQVGHELGVQYVIEGSVRRDFDHVRITAQLIQTKDQTHIWAKQYDRELKNLLTVQSEIAQEIGDEIQLTLGSRHEVNAARRPAAASTPTTSYEAYDLYLKGRYFWNKRTPAGFQQAAEYFQQSVGKDPSYARAYAGLADTYGLMSTWYQVPQNEYMPRARQAALKALALDETLAEAHTSLALIAENYDYDWQTAEKEFRRAIQLNPDYATAHQWYAEYLSWQGRFDEALAESERARQLDPLSMIIAVDHAAIFYYARQYDRAMAQCQAVREMDPSFSDRSITFGSLLQEGKFEEALNEIERGHPAADSPGTWILRAVVYGRWGKTEQAQQALARVEHYSAQSGMARVRLLPAYVNAGRKDQAMALLQEAYAEHSNAVLTIKVDPLYDPLRSDPRFQALERRLGLAQ